MKLSPSATAAVGSAAVAGNGGTTSALAATSVATSAARRNMDTAVSSIPSNVKNLLGSDQIMERAPSSMFRGHFPINSLGIVAKSDAGPAGSRGRGGEHEA